ncbi:fatty acid desaturase [Shimia sp. CNT1-13L.2]|uniref:fatty acid desaturase n=1 Tax=Shimia sp. CNT1-13L.2 TaxID=2959663 RepID=UPI0020CBE247|nr:fatty acid desaturase [Shimia sp. CNT1-13L.2]MCP9481705.1 fatty acid desaturase [Shimia sp. CNT1-13L.2]
MSDPRRHRPMIEWPTLAMLMLCYGTFILGTTWAGAVFLPLGIVLTTLAIALHSSLTHEVLHGHPFRNQRLSDLTVFPAIGLAIPYYRFRDTHLAHHNDSILTDPYDDPESNYLDASDWEAMPGWLQVIRRMNNTLLGRLVLGPALGQVCFMAADWKAIRAGDHAVLTGWLWHVPALAIAVWWMVSVSVLPIWAYLLSAYMALSILKIRTFLEHQAHERARGRTVIIEDHGPLAWIFLYNSLHVVHHMHPKVAWYNLPVLFRDNRDRYMSRNDSYYFRSYREIFSLYFLRAKDPVPHPLWRRK